MTQIFFMLNFNSNKAIHLTSTQEEVIISRAFCDTSLIISQKAHEPIISLLVNYDILQLKCEDYYTILLMTKSTQFPSYTHATNPFHSRFQFKQSYSFIGFFYLLTFLPFGFSAFWFFPPSDVSAFWFFCLLVFSLLSFPPFDFLAFYFLPFDVLPYVVLPYVVHPLKTAG